MYMQSFKKSYGQIQFQWKYIKFILNSTKIHEKNW